MELLLSHHWSLPKSNCIPIIQHRLEFCFLNNQSLEIDLDVYDCTNAIGRSIPSQLQQRILSFVTEANELDVDEALFSSLRIGSSEVFAVLQRDWYVTSGRLFISQQIGRAEFLKSLAYFQHHKALYIQL